MNRKIWTKILASMLVVTLTLANFILLGVYASNSYATTDNLEKQSTVTNNENVTFDAYFKDEKGNTTHTIRSNMSKQDLKLYVAVQVQKGYLKNANIQVLGENGTSSNIALKNGEGLLEYVEKIDETTNTISLKQINGGTQVVLELPVVASKGDHYDLSNFSKLNNIVLTGSYVGDQGKEIKLQKTIQTRTEWTEEANPILEQEVVRFIPYTVNEKTGTILQTLVRSGIENHTLPIAETNITIMVPQVNGAYPESVSVVPKGILATNGKGQESFGQDNWNYDKTTGKLTIMVKNEAIDNQVSWTKTNQDEFIVTYIYQEKVDTLQAVQNATLEIKAYNSVETKLTKNHELTISQSEVLGQIVSGTIHTTEALSKGYLYTKAQREIGYQETVSVDVSYPELVDGLTIKQDMDYFVSEEGKISPTTVSNTNYAYYKTTKINRANFEKILGTEGTLTITNGNGETLATFNKDTVTDENGDYVFSYEAQVNQIAMVTSKPTQAGTLEIKHEKSLIGNTDYSREQVENFKTLKVMANIEATAENNVISNIETAKEIAFVAPTTKIETSISNPNLSTVVTNENVELRVILKTNDISCDLYKNPTIEMILPSDIKQLNIKDVNLLFDNQLTVKDYNTYVNEDGNIVIRVQIEGEQTTYSGDEISKGANLIINTDITLKQLTPTKDDVMKVYVTNELATTYEKMEVTRARSVEQRGYSEASLRAVAPVGMVTTNTISGYNAKNESVTSMSSQEQIGKLDVKKEARTATVSMNVINNYQNTVNKVSILGRVPTAGSKHADTLEEFNSNLEATMASAMEVTGIDASHVEIYYSTNAEASKDINVPTNGWTKTPENMANVKSYLIVINGDLATGSTLGMSYHLAIPENLSYNVQAYSNYVVYFDNVKPEGTISEKVIATKVGLETGNGPELEVTMTSDRENSNVEEGQMITYTMKVKNVGKEAVKNVTVSGNIPEKTVYTYLTGTGEGEDTIDRTYDKQKKTYSEVIQNLEVGETKTITYQVETQDLTIAYDENGNAMIMGEDEEGNPIEIDGYTITNTAKATVEGYDAEFTSEALQHKIVQGYVNINMNVATIPATYVRAEGDKITYTIDVKNVNEIEKKQISVKTTLPEGLTYQESNESGTYNNQTRELTWNIETLQGNETIHYQFTVEVDELGQNNYEKVFTTKASVIGERTVESNEVSITVQKAKLTITQSSDTKSTVSVGDTITYHFEIKNEGKGEAPLVELTDHLPEGLQYELAQYSFNGKTYSSKLGTGDTASIVIAGLKAGETLNVSIKTTAKSLEDGASQKQVTNKATVKAEGISEVTSNEITHTIVPKSGSSTDDPSIDQPMEGTYTISGIAWLDTNHDGKRDDNEQRMAGIPVILINAENGQIIKDIETNREKKQDTNANGVYTFANLKPGKYMVVFLYDAGNYGVTLYQQEGVNDDRNSDAVQMNIVYEGTSRVAGASNTINVNSENIGNIDIGLVSSPKFDLKLDKVIHKITVSDANGTDEYDYQDTKLAKLDLKSKTAIGSSVMIEYKIRVTNEGGVAGYAKKIVDYMPSDMKFTSELNKDWYTGENGTNLYNASLANTLIQPGETKEVTLLLTKKITESNMGIINNTAEIAESDNDLGLQDIDSKPANKVQTEDDMSSADTIIGTKTGEVYLYITITLLVVAMFGVGIYIINKKVLPRV